jgi:hypothetical protein
MIQPPEISHHSAKATHVLRPTCQGACGAHVPGARCQRTTLTPRTFSATALLLAPPSASVPLPSVHGGAPRLLCHTMVHITNRYDLEESHAWQKDTVESI